MMVFFDGLHGASAALLVLLSFLAVLESCDCSSAFCCFPSAAAAASAANKREGLRALIGKQCSKAYESTCRRRFCLKLHSNLFY